MADTDTDNTTDDDLEPAPEPCPVCGLPGPFIDLDDGTRFCQAHRGPTDTDAAPPHAAEASTPPPERTDVANEGLPTLPESGGGEDVTDVWIFDPAVRMVASLVFDAALRSFNPDGTFGDPAVGWAPDGEGTTFIVEAGAQLAVAVLIEAIPELREMIPQLSAAFRGETTPTTEENDD